MEKDYNKILANLTTSVRKLDAKEAKFLKNTRFGILIIELVLTIAGYWLIIANTNWWVAVGLFLFTWGNNISIMRNVYKYNNNLKELWKDN